MMIFNKNLLGQMKRELEARTQQSWFDAYISTSSRTEQSCVSDYDTYANWMLRNYPEKALIRPFREHHVDQLAILEYMELVDKHNRGVQAVLGAAF
jgi:hypothetical protein